MGRSSWRLEERSVGLMLLGLVGTGTSCGLHGCDSEASKESVDVTEVCDDGLDNDGDGDVDCADFACRKSPDCVEDCENGVDDDADGLIDCEDGFCFEVFGCYEDCGDGLDGDDDGLVDCDDPDCMGTEGCIWNLRFRVNETMGSIRHEEFRKKTNSLGKKKSFYRSTNELFAESVQGSMVATRDGETLTCSFTQPSLHASIWRIKNYTVADVEWNSRCESVELGLEWASALSPGCAFPMGLAHQISAKLPRDWISRGPMNDSFWWSGCDDGGSSVRATDLILRGAALSPLQLSSGTSTSGIRYTTSGRESHWSRSRLWQSTWWTLGELETVDWTGVIRQ